MNWEDSQLHPILSGMLERKFKCFLCDLSFFELNDLNSHIKSHVGISPSEKDAPPDVKLLRNSDHSQPSMQEEESSGIVKDEVKTESKDDEDLLVEGAPYTNNNRLRLDASMSKEEDDKESSYLWAPSKEKKPAFNHSGNNLQEMTQSDCIILNTEDNGADVASNCDVWEKAEIKREEDDELDSLLDEEISVSASNIKKEESDVDHSVGGESQSSTSSLPASSQLQSASCSSNKTVNENANLPSQFESLLEKIALKLIPKTAYMIIVSQQGETVVCCVEVEHDIFMPKKKEPRVQVRIGGYKGEIRDKYAKALISSQNFAMTLIGSKEVVVFIGVGALQRPKEQWRESDLYFQYGDQEFCLMLSEIQVVRPQRPNLPDVYDLTEETILPNYGKLVRLAAESTARTDSIEDLKSSENSAAQTLSMQPLKENMAEKSKPEGWLYICPLCQKSFTKLTEIVRHSCAHREKQSSGNEEEDPRIPDNKSSSHGDENIYKCEVGRCHMAFKQFSHLLTHSMTHVPKEVRKCKLCNKTFESSISLIHHLTVDHPPKKYECKICQKKLANVYSLTIHERSHWGDKRTTCKICNKKLAYSTSLGVHMRVHTGERPFACKFCPARFTTRGAVNVHMRRHTGEKRFECKVCHKYFISKHALIDHSYVHTGERSHTCEKCGKSYSRASYLTVHMKMHAGVKKYVCDVCGKKFSQSCNMKTHRKTHFKTKNSD